jgi:hypothetical protein
MAFIGNNSISEQRPFFGLTDCHAMGIFGGLNNEVFWGDAIK